MDLSYSDLKLGNIIPLPPQPKMPEGDVLVHAGDFSGTGTVKEVFGFVEFLRGLPYRQKVVIAVGDSVLAADL